jgi:hypothetical protein
MSDGGIAVLNRAVDLAWRDCRATVKLFAGATVAKDDDDLAGTGWIDLCRAESYLRGTMLTGRMRAEIGRAAILREATNAEVERRFVDGRYLSRDTGEETWAEAPRRGIRHLDDPAWPFDVLRGALAHDGTDIAAETGSETVVRVSRAPAPGIEWPDRGRPWLGRRRPVDCVELRVWTDRGGRIERLAYAWAQNRRPSWLEVRPTWTSGSS